MELRPGYKLTDLGAIPDDWSVSTVGEEFSVHLGKMLDAERNTGELKPYLGNRAVQWGRIDIDDLPLVPMSQTDQQKYRLRAGDLLVCEGGEVGRAAIWEDALDECYYQKALHRLRPRKGYRSRLMLAVLRQHTRSGMLANHVTQTSIAHLPREKFLLVPIPQPAEHEQDLIVGVLGDVDALVVGLDHLIEKKRDLKQAAMQQLLTGQTRLCGFHREWEVKRLGDHVSFLKHGVFPRAATLTQGTVRYLHYGDIHGATGVILDPAEVALPFLSSQDSARLDRLVSGDLVFADASEDLAGVGKSVEIRNAGADEVVAGLHTIAARFDPRVLADGFKAYLQHMPAFRNHLLRLAAGTKVLATNRGHIASAELALPDTDEQIAVAAILADMDAELAALEARRDKTRALKEAMMQELLTGRTRLI